MNWLSRKDYRGKQFVKEDSGSKEWIAKTGLEKSSWYNKRRVIKFVIIALLMSSRRALPFLDNVRLVQDKSNIGSMDSDEESSLSSLSEADID